MQTRSQKRERIEFPIQGRIYIYKNKRKIVPIYLEEDIQEESYSMMASVLEESGVNEFKKKKQFMAQVQLIQLPFCTDKFLQKNGSVFRLERSQFQQVKKQIEQAKQELKKQGNENKKQKIDQSVVIENKWDLCKKILFVWKSKCHKNSNISQLPFYLMKLEICKNYEVPLQIYNFSGVKRDDS